MEWLNEPANWQRTGDVLTVSVDPSTDFWRETGYGYIRDSGHVYGEVLAGDLDVSVRMRCTLGTQYDQAGVMLRADERTWLKTGVEFFEGRSRLSTVLTLGRSSWMVTDLPEGTDEIVLRVSRRGDAVEVRYVIEDGGPAELAALVFMPPGREVLAGVMAAAPEGPGFRVTFHDLRITERDWSGAAGDAPSWSGDQAGWTGNEAPGWSPADGEPGWPAPETGEDAPAGPATAEEEPPAWPVSGATDAGPQWQGPPAGDDAPWPVPAAQGDDPGWRAAAGGEEDPGWEPPGDDEAGWVAALTGSDEDDEPAWAAAPVAAEAGDQVRPGADAPGVADSPEPGGPEPTRAEPAGADPARAEPARAESTGAEPTGAEPAEEPVKAGSIAAALAGPQPVHRDPAEPEAAAGDEPAPGAAAGASVADEPTAEEPTDTGGGGTWSPAPLAGHLDSAKPATGDRGTDVDPAADWERLAKGAQAAPRRAQMDADVASEWPGPPLRSAMRNGLLARDAESRPARGQSEDDAQTDPGLPRPGQATEQPSRMEDSLPAPSETGAAAPGEQSAAAPPAASATEPDENTAAAPARPDPPQPAQSGREARRDKSRRAAANVHTEPDAADEWISLLTADPEE
jgi:uncharacterized protein